MSAPNHLVLVADIVKSTSLDEEARRNLQSRLESLLSSLSTSHADQLSSRIVLTRGDSFQAVIEDSAVVAEILWDVWLALGQVKVRFGFGFGPIYTALNADPRVMDGPAFHYAAKPLSRGRAVAFRGFGDLQDVVLTGIGTLMRTVFERFTERQLEVIERLREGASQSDAAARLGVSRQAVSQLVRTSGWRSYREGERALTDALALFMRDQRSDE